MNTVRTTSLHTSISGSTKKILLFASRSLCYESNFYFSAQISMQLELNGFETEMIDLTEDDMEQKLELLLNRKDEFLCAIDFNSLLPRVCMDVDGEEYPYLDLLGIPFFNYIVDHPLYHHPGLCRPLKNYYVICIDQAHQAYVNQFYPQIRATAVIPLGAHLSETDKRIQILFPASYVPETMIRQEIMDSPAEKRKELLSLIEMMAADPHLKQEDALQKYLDTEGIQLDTETFAMRLNQDYLADKYIRYQHRAAVLDRAAESGLPVSVLGRGWDEVKYSGTHSLQFMGDVGYAVSTKMIASAEMLLNVTPRFHGGLHDRVYLAMAGRTLSLTEESSYTRCVYDGQSPFCTYAPDRLEELPSIMTELFYDTDKRARITEEAFRKASENYTWEVRVRQLIEFITETVL